MKFKKAQFRDEQTMQVDVAEVFEVRWQSRHGEFSYATRPEIRVFAKEKDAISFRDALRDAFRLIKHTSGTEVSITKQQIG